MVGPLTAAGDSQGYLLVGNDGRNNIEVCDPVDGNCLASFGDGQCFPRQINEERRISAVFNLFNENRSDYEKN